MVEHGFGCRTQERLINRAGQAPSSGALQRRTKEVDHVVFSIPARLSSAVAPDAGAEQQAVDLLFLRSQLQLNLLGKVTDTVSELEVELEALNRSAGWRSRARLHKLLHRAFSAFGLSGAQDQFPRLLMRRCRGSEQLFDRFMALHVQI